MEVGALPEKEFRVGIINVIKKFRTRLDGQSEKLQVSFLSYKFLTELKI